MPDHPATDPSSAVHTMRLHGPWVCQSEGGVRCRVPLRLEELHTVLGHHWQDPIVLQRSFGCPTGLSSRSRVFLRWVANDFPTTWQLNDRPLGQSQAGKDARIDITDLLQPRNLLTVECSLETNKLPSKEHLGNPWLVRSVLLEIEEPS